MDDPFAMRGLESRRNAGGAPQCLAQRHRAPEEALLQRFSFDELENQDRRVLSLDDVEERADVGMVDVGDEARFALNAHETIGIGGERCREDLDGNVSPKANIARTIHLAHGAVTQQAHNLISPEPIAGL